MQRWGSDNLRWRKRYKEIFTSIEKNYIKLTILGINLLEEKAVLFEDELDFLKTFIDTDIKMEKTITLSREDIAKKQSRKIKTETNYASLRQQMTDIRREKPDTRIKTSRCNSSSLPGISR